MKFSRRHQTLIAVSFMALLVIALIYSVEFETVEVNRGYSKEARKNPFLAAQHLFERYEIESERAINFTLLDMLNRNPLTDDKSHAVGVNDTIILVNSRGTIDGRRFENLWRWVNNGGNLVTTLENPFVGASVDDELLRAMGIYIEHDGDIEKIEESLAQNRAYQEHDERLEEDADSASFVYSDGEACRDPSFSRELTLSPVSLSIDFLWGNEFEFGETTPRWSLPSSAESDSSYLAGSFAVGAGHVTMLSHASIWRNQFIQCHDHAYFLLSLVGDSAKVWVLENRDAPSLVSLAYRYIPQGIVAFLVMLILLIWAALTRFGPIFHTHSAQRKSFYEHIFASAVFLWKRGEYIHLLQDLRESVDVAMNRRVPVYVSKSLEEKVMLLEKLSRVKHPKLRDAIFSQHVESLDDFVAFVKILKDVKDNL